MNGWDQDSRLRDLTLARRLRECEKREVESARLIASLNGQVYDWRRIAEALGYVEGDA